MSDTNEHEERNRAAKAYRLVRRCELARFGPAEVEAFSDGTWEILARIAKVNFPSRRTRLLVVHILRDLANG